ncbi:MAG: APC family permease [Solirubrobacteraceae bacterium]|nr:MAG: amino acid permease [Solirubrobacterales bacterium]
MPAVDRVSRSTDAGGAAENHDEPAVALTPSAGYRPLSDQELSTLAQVGHHWTNAVADRKAWDRALPVDPRLGPLQQPSRRGSRLQQVGFRLESSTPAVDAGEVEATREATAVPYAPARAVEAIRRLVLGAPLRSTAVIEERMRRLIALPILSSDALSSVAYGPEAMLAVLVLAGSSALSLSLPIAAVIVVLMVSVGLSYRQTIRAYPKGGGSYIVASSELGELPGLTAAAGLMIDYVLTVAVSIAAGVAAITSAVPSMRGHQVLLGLIAIAVLLAGNLRGVRQAGMLFSAPTYAFIVAILLLTAVGLIDAAGRGFSSLPRPHVHATEALGLLVVLRAFASGSTAMTGIEAISDGIPAFRRVEWRNARTTLTWMVSLLIVMFIGTMIMTSLDGVLPSSSQTVLSQLASIHFGHGGVLYVFTQASTAAILLLAANTAYSDFPRLLFFLARDFHAPRAFLRMGDRLAFSNGIVALTVAAAAIYVAFGGMTDKLIPLFAVGVFLAFTLSQSGMVRHWLHGREQGWRHSLFFNALGAGLSCVVLIVTSLTKFTEGAWIVVILVPLLVILFLRIRIHYDRVGEAIRLHRLPFNEDCQPVLPHNVRSPQSHVDDGNDVAATEDEESPDAITHLIVAPVVSMDLASLRTLAYGAALGQPLLAVHLAPDADDAERFARYWRTWGDHLPLQIIQSPYRSLVVPMAHYIEALQAQRPNLTITVLLPELVVKRAWHRLLHNQIAPRLRRSLRQQRGVVVATVPFHLPG